MRGGYKTVYGADAPWESFRDDDGDDGFGGGREGETWEGEGEGGKGGKREKEMKSTDGSVVGSVTM